MFRVCFDVNMVNVHWLLADVYRIENVDAFVQGELGSSGLPEANAEVTHSGFAQADLLWVLKKGD